MLRPSPRRSFYVAVSRTDCDAGWCWEIRRKRRPIRIRLQECSFTSYRSAELAGKQALEEFLNGLSLESGVEPKSDFGAGTEIARSRHRALRR
jgi:hypothetical protein